MPVTEGMSGPHSTLQMRKTGTSDESLSWMGWTPGRTVVCRGEEELPVGLCGGLVMLETEPRASDWLGKCSTSELHPPQ